MTMANSTVATGHASRPALDALHLVVQLSCRVVLGASAEAFAIV